MADIDSLSIQIESSSEKAIQQIDKVIAALERLKAASEQKYGFKSISDSLKEINSSTFSKIRQLSESLKTLSTAGKISISDSLAYNIADLGDAINGINESALRKLGFFGGALRQLEGLSKITISSKLGNSIGDMIAALDLMEQGHIDRLQQFGTAMQALKGIGSKTGAALEKLPMQLAKLADEMDHISVGGIAKLDKMCAALSKLQGVKLTGFSSAVKQAKKEMEQAANVNVSSDLEAGSNSFVTNIQNAREMIEALSPGLADLSDKFDLMAARAETAFARIRDSAGNVKTALMEALGQKMDFNFSWANNIKQIEKYWQNVGNALTSFVGPGLKVVISLVGKLASSVLNVARNIAKWAFNTAINAVKNIWGLMKKIASAAMDVAKKLPAAFADLTHMNAVANALKKISQMVSGLARIAMYRVFRSAIKAITEAFKEGSERAYFYAKQYGEATRYIAEAMDRLSSGSFKMQNQLGASWATLLATIEPILIQIIGMVTKAAEVVTQFFAVLGGSGTYLKAKDYTKAWADETEKGAAAAKEWKNQILGFDEINRLEAPSDTNRGSGKNDYTDYENMFEEAKVKSWIKELADMFKGDDWGKIGTLLGDKLNDITNKFDWKGWGQKIGKSIQKGIDLAYNFLSTYDFKNLGSKLAQFIDSTADEMDFNRLGRLATKVSTSIWDILYGAFTNPGSMGRLARNLSDFIIGALTELAEWIESLDSKKISDAIRDFFTNLKTGEIKNAFVRVIQDAWNLAVAVKNDLFPEGLLPTLARKISEWVDKVPWEQVGETIVTGFTTAWGFITEQFEKIWPKDKRDEFKANVNKKLQEIINNIDWEGLFAIIQYNINKFMFGEKWANWDWNTFGHGHGREVVAGVVEGVKSETEYSYQKQIEGYITDPVSEALADMEKKASGSGKALSEGVKKAADNSKSSVGSMKTEINKDSSTIKSDMDKINSSTKSVSSSMQSMQNRSSSAMRNMANTTSSSSRSIVSSLSQVVAKAREAFNSLSSLSSAKFSATVTPGKTKRYATGGFLEDGLFTMNHGEIAGRFSNGQSVVANNEMITDGIAAAVYGAFTRAFAEIGGTGSEQHGDIVLKINDREFARATYPAYKAVAREKGISMISNFA